MIRSLACLLALLFVVASAIYLPGVVAHWRASFTAMHHNI